MQGLWLGCTGVQLLPVCMRVQSFLTLGDPMDCSPPSSSVPGISQARKLEWIVISYYRGSFQPRDQTCISCLLHWLSDSLPLNHLGSPQLLPTTAVFVYILRLKTESESHSVVSDPLWPHCLYSPWNSPSQNTGMSSLSLLQGIFPIQGSNPGFPHCRWILYQLSHKGSPKIQVWVAYSCSSRSSQPRNWTRLSCVAGGFFTSWAIR